MKRIVSALLVVLMLSSLLPGTVSAAGGEYIVNSIYMYDTSENGIECEDIPEMPFYTEISITNAGSAEDAAVLFVWYGFNGQMLGVQRVDYPSGTWRQYLYYTALIDNTDGRIGSVKAFVVPRNGAMRPLAEVTTIEKKLPAASISGITVSDGTVSVSAASEVDCNMVVQILSEETSEVLWTGEAGFASEDTTAEFTADVALPAHFIVTGRLYHIEHGVPLGDLYTCLDYTKGFETFRAKTEYDYDADHVIDVGKWGDGSFIVLADDVRRISMVPMSEDGGSYTFLAGAVSTVSAGDKICFRNNDGVYTTIRVASISFSNGDAIITEDSSAMISDLYKVIKINSPVKAYPSDTNAAAALYFDSEAALSADGGDLYTGIELGPAISSNINTSFGSLDAELRAGGQVVAYYDPSIWGDDYMRIDMMTRVSMEGDLTIGAAGWWWEDVLLFPEVSLAGLEIIGHIPLTLTGEFEIDCESGVNMHIAADVTSGYTFTTLDGTQKFSQKTITPSDIDAHGSLEVEVGLRFAVGVELLNDLISASIGVGAGLGVEGEIEFPLVPTFSTPEFHACDCCLNGRCYAYLNASLDLNYEVSKKIRGNLLNLELVRAEWTIGKIYISLLNDADSIHEGKVVFGWGECPNKKYLVTLLTYNNGRQKDGQSVSILDCDALPVDSGVSPFKTYLYPETYAAEALVETNEAHADFVVTGSTVVSIHAKDPILSGSVTDVETGEPISGATVMVLKDGESFRTAQTDGAGGYSLQLPGGAYKVSFVKDGYESQVRELSNIQKDTGMSVALELIKDPGVLTGTVTDEETGEPISGATVTVSSDTEDTVYTQTGSSGSYTVEVKAGEYRLSFSHEDYTSASASAAPKAGETVAVNASLKKILFPLSITVTDRITGEGIAGASVSLHADGESVTSSVTDSTGACTVKLPNGEYTLSVSAENYNEATQNVTIDGEEAAVSVQLAGILASGYCGDGDYYSVKWVLSADGVMTVSGGGGVRGANSSNLTTRSYDAYNDQIKTLIVEEGVTYAKENAFRSLTSLQSVVLPKGFTTIEEGGFYDCSDLRSIELPDTLTTIGEDAFYRCSALTSIDMPDSVTTLGKAAFRDCSSLQYARLSNSLTEIDDKMFQNCTSLVVLKLPNKLTHIHEWAFYGCTSLAELNLPDTLLWIMEFGFAGCTSLRDIRIPASVSLLGENVFYTSGAETVWIDPASELIEIPKYAFEDCENLKTVYLPASVKDIRTLGLNQYIPSAFPDGTANKEHLPAPSTIEHVYFGGNEDEWNALDVYFVWSNAAATVTKTYSAAQYFGEYSDTVVTLNWQG